MPAATLVRTAVASRAGGRLKRAAPYAVVLVAGLWLYHVAGQFDFTPVPGRIGPDAWPKIVLGLMIAVAAYGMVAALLSSGAGHGLPPSDALDEALATPPETHPHLAWAGVGATAAYLLALPVIGFFVATCLFVAVLIRLGRYRNLRHILLISPAAALAFMFLFMRVVYVALPIGRGWFAGISLAIMAMMGIR